MILRIIILICALVSAVCFGFGARVKRRNWGFLLYTVFLIGCYIAVFFILGSKGITSVRKFMPLFYIFHAWLYFEALAMILLMGAAKKTLNLLIPSGIVCIYQTAIIASSYFGSHVMIFSKPVLFGGSWWVAEKSGVGNAFWSFGTYRGLLFINFLLIIASAVIGCIHIAKGFRNKFYLIIAFEIFYCILEFFSVKHNWPVWILSLILLPVVIIAFYIVNYYPNRKLREWSLAHFANNLNDGFVLYNEYGDPVYMNDAIKTSLNDELIEEFKDIKNFNYWISQSVEIEGIDIVICGNEDGEYYFRVKKMELCENGHFLGTIFMLHNTTETILRLSAMKEANLELDRAAKMKADFLANMSHEIRTPMNAVIGMAELALREKLPPNVTDYIKQIQSSGKNLLNIINDILDFSKIEAGKMDICPMRYEPLSEINDIANILINRIGEKRIELFVTGDNEIPNALTGDSMRIRQVIINLANNAIKFTDEGMVHISLSSEKISDEEINLTCHVRDTGRGIKEEDLGKLFQSFQQVDSKRNRAIEGNGLGLAISKSLCEAMGGSIGVNSTYGVGSDFFFTLPQPIVDPKPALYVRDASDKHAFIFLENDRVVDVFLQELVRFGVMADRVRNLKEYVPTGKKDFLFFIEEMYGDDIRSLLNKYPDLKGVVIVDYSSGFEADLPNLIIMHRPLTSLNIVRVLNGLRVLERTEDKEKVFKIDFKAPAARLLVVDDNEINIKITRGLIEPIGAECIGAVSGKEAIEKISREKFDIVFMDHMMPEMDGVEATHLIRETIPGAENLPIIALTANVMEGVKEMFIEEGMNDFVAKPVYVKELAKKIKQWLPPDKVIMLSEDELLSGGDPEFDGVRFDGLDNDKAIETLGSAKLFVKIVKEYYRAGDEKRESILADYFNENWTDFTIKVHALKSASRQIGAFDLGDLAADLEKAGKEKDIDFIKKNTMPLLDMYRELLDKISASLNKIGAENKALSEISKGELRKKLENLSESCENLDSDKMEEIKDELLSVKIPEGFEEEIKKLIKAIDDIDTDACEEIIGSVLERLT